MAVIKHITIKNSAGVSKTNDFGADASNVFNLASVVGNMAAQSAVEDSNGNAITSYLKSATAENNTLTLTRGDNEQIIYTPITFAGESAGLVPPAENIEDENYYLNANGDWIVIDNGAKLTGSNDIKINENKVISLKDIEGFTPDNNGYGNNAGLIEDPTTHVVDINMNQEPVNVVIPMFSVDDKGRIISAGNKQVAFRNDNTIYRVGSKEPFEINGNVIQLKYDSNDFKVENDALTLTDAENKGENADAVMGVVGITDVYKDITTLARQPIAASAFALQSLYARLRGLGGEGERVIPLVIPVVSNENASNQLGAIWFTA